MFEMNLYSNNSIWSFYIQIYISHIYIFIVNILREDSLFLAWGGATSPGGAKNFQRPAKGGEKFSKRPEGGAKNFQRVAKGGGRKILNLRFFYK